MSPRNNHTINIVSKSQGPWKKFPINYTENSLEPAPTVVQNRRLHEDPHDHIVKSEIVSLSDDTIMHKNAEQRIVKEPLKLVYYFSDWCDEEVDGIKSPSPLVQV